MQNNFGRNSQGKNSTWDDCVNEFNASAYAADAASTGAKYAVLTMMQQSKYIIAPSQSYDGYTGFKPGSAAASRDLVLDVHAALEERGLKLMLYWTCDGPSGDEAAHAAVGWPNDHTPGCTFEECAAGKCECTVPPTYLKRWPV